MKRWKNTLLIHNFLTRDITFIIFCRITLFFMLYHVVIPVRTDRPSKVGNSWIRRCVYNYETHCRNIHHLFYRKNIAFIKSGKLTFYKSDKVNWLRWVVAGELIWVLRYVRRYLAFDEYFQSQPPKWQCRTSATLNESAVVSKAAQPKIGNLYNIIFV